MKTDSDMEFFDGMTNKGQPRPEEKVSFCIKNIVQLNFNLQTDEEHRYSVLVYTSIYEPDTAVFISKETYKYLQKKLGANNDEN